MKTAAFFAFLLLICSAFGTIVKSYIDEQGRPIDHHVGTYLVKDKMQNLYRVKYDVEMLGGNLIINVDEVKGIRKVQCDITNIELMVDFNSVPDAYSFYKTITAGNYERFVSGAEWNCSDVQTGSMMLLRKVIEVEINGVSVLLRTSDGSYEEAIKDGSFSLDRAEEPQEHAKTLCFGVNQNKECTAASRPLPIYHNKYIDVQCSNCFVGAKATVFIDIKISWFKLRYASAGLRDIAINGGFVLDMAAQGSASGTIDKTYSLVDAGLVVQFWIGPIPITIWYEIPLRMVATAAVSAQAKATAGVTANWNFGNAFVTWDENNGWKVAKPNPTFTWTPILKGEASFDAEASLAIIPSFIIHAMRLVHAGVKVTPTVMLAAHGDTTKKELCADLTYKIIGDIFAGITINVPFVKLFEKNFGPYELFNTGVKPIGHWCVKG